ncbi:MAG: phage portal protein [Hyphomicrobium sp.]
MLLGIPGDNTYSNYAEAQRAFWKQTVLPLVNRMAQGFSNWLSPAYGTKLLITPDLDQVEALNPEREALFLALPARVPRAGRKRIERLTGRRNALKYSTT